MSHTNNITPNLRIIADVHGKYRQLRDILVDCDYALQLGDFGYNYDILNEFDSKRLKIIRGNHECHDQCDNYPHFLPHGFGEYSHGGVNFFYLSGAFSIDWQYRIKQEQAGLWPKTWFEEEELTLKQLDNAVHLYDNMKPEVVITHECPRSISNIIGNPNVLRSWGYDPKTFTTRTSEALDAMFRLHQPKLYVHGHYHKDYDMVVHGTRFIGLGELSYIDVEADKGTINVSKN